MNSSLYGKQIKVPQELISLLKEKQKLGAGKSKEELSARANLRAQQLLRTNPSKAGTFASKGEQAAESARELGANVEEIEMQLGVENPQAYRATRQAMTNIAPHSSNATY